MKKRKIKPRPVQNKSTSDEPVAEVKEVKKSRPSLSMKYTPDLKSVRNLKIGLGIIIALFSFFLYEQSIGHDYTLDDHAVVDENTITTRGFSGIPTLLKTDYWYGSRLESSRGPVYRPTSMVVFATIWQFYPNNPHAYHFINVMFYAITCVVLFLVLCRLFRNENLLFPFICAVLYAAHPIHTEVVNNIKSLDEILCFLFGLVSTWLFLKYSSSKSILALVLGAASYFLSLLSKETGIAFLAIIPVAIYFFGKSSLKRLGVTSLILVAITGLWFLLRSIVFKDLPQNPGNVTSILNNTLNAAPDTASRYATAFYILLRYIGLLIFPHPLTSDYSFSQIKIQTLGDPFALIGIVVYLGLAIYSVINFRKKSILTFGILFYLITLAPVSNVFFLGGWTMAERLMYMPSLGFCIVLTYLLFRLTKTEALQARIRNLIQFITFKPALLVLMLGIAALYSFKTVSRSKDWKDNITIFSKDVKTSRNSARANQILGSSLMLSGMRSPYKQNQVDTFQLAKRYLKRALEIYPQYYSPLSHLGVIYLYELKLDSAHDYLKKGLALMPNDVDLNFNYGLALFHLKKHDEAIKVLTHTIQLAPQHENAYFNLGALHQNKLDYDSALFYYSKAIEINPNNATAYYHSGSMYRARGDTARANRFMEKAASLGYKVN